MKKCVHLLFAIALGLSSLRAADYYWSNTEGDWDTPTNWNPLTVPGENDTVRITANATITRTSGTSAISQFLHETPGTILTLSLSNNASILPRSESGDIRLATAENTSAKLLLSGNASISANNTLFAANSANASANISLSGNASLFLNSNAFIAEVDYCDTSSRSSANITLSDNATFFLKSAYIAHSGNCSANITLRDDAALSANGTLLIACFGQAAAEIVLSGNAYLSAESNINIARAKENTDSVSANITLRQNAVLIAGDTLSLAQNAADSTGTRASANITLHDQSTLAANQILCALNKGALAITIHPQASIVANNLHGTDTENTSLRFIVSHDSPLDIARIRLSPDAAQEITLPSRISIDATACTRTADIPLISICGNNNGNIPGDTSAYTITTNPSVPAANATLLWKTDTVGNSTTLLLCITDEETPPPPPPTLDTQEHQLIYALTDNYTLNPDNTPTTNGSTAHLPRVTLDTDGTLSMTLTPLRPGYTYEVQYSTDLRTWTTIKSIQGHEDAASEKVSAPAESDSPKKFLRLKITPP